MNDDSVSNHSAKFWWDKALTKQSFQSFGEENVGEFTIINN